MNISETLGSKLNQSVARDIGQYKIKAWCSPRHQAVSKIDLLGLTVIDITWRLAMIIISCL